MKRRASFDGRFKTKSSRKLRLRAEDSLPRIQNRPPSSNRQATSHAAMAATDADAADAFFAFGFADDLAETTAPTRTNRHAAVLPPPGDAAGGSAVAAKLRVMAPHWYALQPESDSTNANDALSQEKIDPSSDAFEELKVRCATYEFPCFIDVSCGVFTKSASPAPSAPYVLLSGASFTIRSANPRGHSRARAVCTRPCRPCSAALRRARAAPSIFTSCATRSHAPISSAQHRTMA